MLDFLLVERGVTMPRAPGDATPTTSPLDADASSVVAGDDDGARVRWLLVANLNVRCTVAHLRNALQARFCFSCFSFDFSSWR